MHERGRDDLAVGRVTLKCGAKLCGPDGYRRCERDLHGSLHLPLGDIERSNIAGTGETRYIGYGIGLSYWFSEHWSVFVGAEGAAWFLNNANTPSLMLGVENKAARYSAPEKQYE